MLIEGQVGPRIVADGSENLLRTDRTGSLVTADGRSHFGEMASRGSIYSLTLNATTGTIAAGNIVAAAAAASTQFAIWNPISSKVNLVLLKFGLGVISGTPPAGPVFHGIFDTGVPTIASVGTARNNFINGPAPTARYVASAAGTALTGGVAPQIQRVANFTQTATAAASAQALPTIELIDGEIVCPPGTGWLPLWSGAGTTLLSAYSITWDELPV